MSTTFMPSSTCLLYTSNQSKQINALYQIHQRDCKKLLHLRQRYAELSACGVMDSKRKDNLKAEISNLINT